MASETRDERVERLARELGREVAAADVETRDELRDYAADVLRTETEATATTGAPRRRRRPLHPLALALFLLVGGGLFTVLLPPVGVILLLTAGVALLWWLVRLAVVGLQRARGAPDA